MKKIFLMLFFVLAGGCQKKEIQKIGIDFESLMGKDLPQWKHVQTSEDFENLTFFKHLFELNKGLLHEEIQELRIPKTIHYIWIGPKPFPRESIENVRSWIAKNPDYTFKFWTDRDRPLPHPQMQLCKIQNLRFEKLAQCFQKSDNYGEQSDLLRLEILNQEGGIYVDHDVTCVSSFEQMNRAFDLFCGLELPYPTSLSTSVWPTNNLVGARVGHPIIKHAMEWLAQVWDQVDADYPGKDRDAIINRIAHRTFFSLGKSFKELANQENNRDIAFPTMYFNAPKQEWALFARHLYAGTWFDNESQFEKHARQRLMYLSKKTNKIILFCGILGGLNLLGFGALSYLLLRRRHGSV